MSDKIKVRITCRERVRYDQTVEMTREQWAALKSVPESRMEDDQMSPLSNWLDMRDPVGSDGFEDVEMYVVNDDNDPVNPSDSYNGDEDA